MRAGSHEDMGRQGVRRATLLSREKIANVSGLEQPATQVWLGNRSHRVKSILACATLIELASSTFADHGCSPRRALAGTEACVSDEVSVASQLLVTDKLSPNTQV